MKLFSAVILLALCSSVSANDGETLAKVKEHAVSNIDKRIGYLQELKSCVSAASDKGAIKTCRADYRTKIKAMKNSSGKSRRN